ncbi:MAG: AraC family transcriptional regulator ligand-binding domain-containing protein [Pseudomonadota bacterium]
MTLWLLSVYDPMMQDNYFATGYVRLLYRLLQAERVSTGVLFTDTGFTATDLMRADFEMPFAAQMQFCLNALAHAPRGLGLRSGHQLQIAAHGALGTVMQSASHLRAALTSFVELIDSRASFYQMRLIERGHDARLEIQVLGLPTQLIPFFAESLCFTVAHCLRFYAGGRTGTVAYHLNYPAPDYGAEYYAVFGHSLKFSQPTMWIGFDRAWLALPSPEADPVVFAESVLRCRSRIHRLQSDDLVSGVEHFLLENPGKLWSVAEVAPVFAVSPRTLIRRLQAGGTSFQALRDNILQRQALVYLGLMSVEATAISLGFAETSSFRRAFKRWFGLAPSARDRGAASD